MAQSGKINYFLLKFKSCIRSRVIQLRTLSFSPNYHMHQIDLIGKKIIHEFICDPNFFWTGDIIPLQITIHRLIVSFKPYVC